MEGTGIDALAVLHLADLYRNPKMEIPSIRDWGKVKAYLEGKWPLPQPRYQTESIAEACHNWFTVAKHAPFVAIDTEYNVSSNYLLLIGLGFPGGKYVLQFDNKSAAWQERHAFGEMLKELVKSTTVVFQNAVADLPVIELAYGIKHGDYKNIEDTMLGHAVLWSDWPHTLEFLASIYGKHNKMKHLSHTDQYLYNVGDVVDTISAWESIRNELRADPRTEKIYRNQSLRAVPIVLRSQYNGLRVNQDVVRRSLDELSRAKRWAINAAQLYCGWPINIGSDDQLKYELYTRERFPIQTIPRSDKWTVDGDAIAALRNITGTIYDVEDEARNGLNIETALEHISQGGHPLLEARVVYAAAQQQLSHYIEPLLERNTEGEVVRIKDVVYPRFLLHAQASGRWSTVDPPMAQIPKSLQSIVEPHPGYKWIEWDWDQIELRLLGALSGDEIYEEAFSKGWDIHTLHTCDVFGWSYPFNKSNPHGSLEDAGWRKEHNWGGKDDPRRRFAKVFIFRLNYGGEAKNATDIPGVKQLGLRPTDLVRGSKLYLSKHPRIRQYWDRIADEGIRLREVRTFMGRRRRMLVDSKSAMKRLIYNHPMQGGVSDVFNTTLIRISEVCPEATFAYGVHDAQKWAVPEHLFPSLFRRMYEVVHTPWEVSGRKTVLPATFKR
jgi:DNA polymerase I-like protein with 3'-5' exonuclease and polymerase domains